MVQLAARQVGDRASRVDIDTPGRATENLAVVSDGAVMLPQPLIRYGTIHVPRVIAVTKSDGLGVIGNCLGGLVGQEMGRAATRIVDIGRWIELYGAIELENGERALDVLSDRRCRD